MRRSPLLLALALGLLALGGCGESGSSGTTATETATAPATAPPSTDGGTGGTTGAEAGAGAQPGEVLERFVQAARTDDFDAMWSLLSQQSRERMGPTIVRFESGAGGELRRQLTRFDPARSNVFLDEAITATFAVAAFGGRAGRGANAPFAAYGAALRREPDGWRLELGGPVALASVAPDPGSTVGKRVRVAAGVRAEERVVESGLWLDGRSVPGRLALTGSRGATMFSEDAPRLVAGPHAVVAFASTLGEASATAWVFRFTPDGG